MRVVAGFGTGSLDVAPHALHRPAKVAVAHLVLGPARGEDAGKPVQRIDAEPAVVGERRQPRQVGRFARLQLGIVDERVADLLGLGKAELGGADAVDAERREQFLDFAQFAGVVGGDDQFLDWFHRPTAFNCAAKISVQPIRASRSSRSRRFLVEGRALGGNLRLDDRAVAGQDEIAVRACGAVLDIIEVEHRRAVVDAAAHRRDLGADRIVGELRAITCRPRGEARPMRRKSPRCGFRHRPG